MATTSDYYGSGSGGVTSADVTALGAIAERDPVYMRASGKAVIPSENIAADSLDSLGLWCTKTAWNYPHLACLLRVNQPAGRAILMGNNGGSYSYGGRVKFAKVNTTTGAYESGYSYTQFHSYTLTSCRYPNQAVWNQSDKSWYTLHTQNAGSYGVLFTRYHFGTDSAFDSTAYYANGTNGFTSSDDAKYGTNSGWYGSTRDLVIDENDNVYYIACGNSDAAGAKSCTVSLVDWSSDANLTTSDIGTAVEPGSSNRDTQNQYTIRGCYDSLNNQIVVAGAGSSGNLWAFDVTSSGGITYSHCLKSSLDAKYINELKTDDAGNFCVVYGSTGFDIGVFKNTGSAFVVSSTNVTRPSLADSSTGDCFAISYIPAQKSWLGVWALARNENAGAYKVWEVNDGVPGTTTVERAGIEKIYNTSGSYFGIYNAYPYEFPGCKGDMSPTGTFFSIANIDSTYGGMRTSRISVNTIDTALLLGVADAAISDGGTGKVFTKGGEKSGYSGLTVGEEYSATQTGTIVATNALTDAQTGKATFLGCASSATSILVGEKLRPDPATGKFAFPSAGQFSGHADNISQTYNFSTSGFQHTTTGMGAKEAPVTVVAAAGAYLLDVAGTGRCIFLAFSANHNTQTYVGPVQMLVDGKVVQTFNDGSSTAYPIIAIGHINSNGSQTQLYAFNEGIAFNRSFQIKNVSGAPPNNQWQMVYRIISYD